MIYKALNRHNLNSLGTEVTLAATFTDRLRGLLGTTCLPHGHGLLIRRCSNVHTLGMAYPIDILFLSDKLQVLKAVSNLQPMSGATCRGSAMVLKLPAGTIECTNTRMGDYIEIKNIGNEYDFVG